ncbi:PcsB-like coiled-coil domain-containing protein, partial [Streptococcus sobrinus]
MKKRILSTVLLSGVALTTAGTIKADDYDAAIANQDSVISNLSAQSQAAQAQSAVIQNQSAVLAGQNAELEAQNNELQAQSNTLAGEIQELSAKIVARNASIQAQAQNAQKNNTATSYINTILNSKSISDAISRIVAVHEVVSASQSQLAQQQADQA